MGGTHEKGNLERGSVSKLPFSFLRPARRRRVSLTLARMEAHKLSARQLTILSWHMDQTKAVFILLQVGAFSIEEVMNIDDKPENSTKRIYEWHVFTELRGPEYEILIEAGYPVIASEIGVWVGFSDYDPGYDDVIHPKLAKALFGVDVTGLEIRAMRVTPNANRASTSDRIRRILA